MYKATLTTIDKSGVTIIYSSTDTTSQTLTELYSLDQFSTKVEALAFITAKVSLLNKRETEVNNKLTNFLTQFGALIGTDIA